MPKKSVRQALNEALKLEMRRDPNVIVMGEDVCGGAGATGEKDAWGGAFGVTKGILGKFIKGINDAMETTIAACGDVNRNVMAAPTPATSPLVDSIQKHAKEVSDALLPKTRAYHQIWVEG